MKKIFLIIITAVGLAILFWGGRLLVESRSALKWPQTKGQVISSLLTIKHLSKFLDINAGPSRWYGTDVQYQYLVDGGLYVSNRISFQVWDARNPQSALKEMNKYRHVHEVPVYYDPADPQQAVLEPANVGDILIPLIIGVLLVFWGLVFLLDQSRETHAREIIDCLRQGNQYQKQGRFDHALAEFDHIIAINPTIAQGYKSRGALNLQQENWDEAIADFDRAISIDPTDAFIYFNRANAYLGKKQYSNAQLDIKKATEMGIQVNPRILEEIKKGL